MPSQLRPKAGFEDISLTIDDRAWLHQSRWSDAEFAWFLARRRQASLQIYHPPSHLHPKRGEIESSSHAWLLLDQKDIRASAWAELHLFKGPNFSNGYIYLMSASQAELVSSHIASLLRLVFMLSQADQIRLLGSMALIDSFAQLVGHAKVLYSLPSKAWHPNAGLLAPLPSLLVTREEWLTSSSIQELSSKHTSHIESRLARQSAVENTMRVKKKKRGLIARIFKPRIEDSIF